MSNLRIETLEKFDTDQIKNPITLKSIQARLQNIDRATKRAYTRMIAELQKYS